MQTDSVIHVRSKGFWKVDGYTQNRSEATKFNFSSEDSKKVCFEVYKSLAKKHLSVVIDSKEKSDSTMPDTKNDVDLND